MIKKTELALSIGTSAFAFTAAFASARMPTQSNKYIQLNIPQTCESVAASCSNYGPVCQIISIKHDGQYVVYGRRVNSTTCAMPLKDNKTIEIIH